MDIFLIAQWLVPYSLILSMALSTYSTLMNIQVHTKKGKFLSLNGQHKSTSHLGPVQYSQTRNILIEHE